MESALGVGRELMVSYPWDILAHKDALIIWKNNDVKAIIEKLAENHSEKQVRNKRYFSIAPWFEANSFKGIDNAGWNIPQVGINSFKPSEVQS